MGIFEDLSNSLQLYEAPVFGHYFPNPLEKHQAENAKRAAATYAAYRPMVADARMNSLNQRAALYQGAIDTLTSMGGGRQPFPVSQLQQNPMSPEMMGIQPSEPTPTSSQQPGEPYVLQQDGVTYLVPEGTPGAYPVSAYGGQVAKGEPGFMTRTYSPPGEELLSRSAATTVPGWYVKLPSGTMAPSYEGAPGAVWYDPRTGYTTQPSGGTQVYEGKLRP